MSLNSFLQTAESDMAWMSLGSTVPSEGPACNKSTLAKLSVNGWWKVSRDRNKVSWQQPARD